MNWESFRWMGYSFSVMACSGRAGEPCVRFPQRKNCNIAYRRDENFHVEVAYGMG